TTIILEKQAVVASSGNGGYVAGHNLLRAVGSVVRAQLAFRIVSHTPQTPVFLEKQAIVASRGNSRNVAGYNHLWNIGSIVGAVRQNADSAVTQFTIAIEAHGP